MKIEFATFRNFLMPIQAVALFYLLYFIKAPPFLWILNIVIVVLEFIEWWWIKEGWKKHE